MKPFFRLLFPIFLATVVGCAPNVPSDLPKLYPCKITVVQNDVPLSGATVLLMPAAPPEPTGTQPWFPTGVTDATGTAILHVNGRYAGAQEGRFKILVRKTVNEESKYGPPPEEDDPQYLMKMEKRADEKISCFSLVETIYSEADTTPLEIEIKKGHNEKSVEVGKAVKVSI